MTTSSSASREWLWVGLAVAALGALVRAALYFPLALFQIDSDGTLAGLCAFRIAAGQHPFFFPGGTRLSAASCYVAAAYFHLFGSGRVGLALTGLTWGVLYLAFMLLFLRALLGPKLACAAMLFAALPSEQFMTVSYVPWGYGEILASCAATLWLGTHWRETGALWTRIAFGFSLGLGIWFSLETLMIALPATIWIAAGRRFAALREAPAAVLGALVGIVPYAVGSIATHFAPLQHNWASQLAPNPPQVFDNALWFLSVQVPKLLFHEPGGFWSLCTPIIAGFAIVTTGFVITMRRERRFDDAVTLLWFVLASCFAIYVASNAGSMRGWTVRYIAPLYLVVPVFCAIGLLAYRLQLKSLAVAAVALIVVPNLLLYSLPGSAMRGELSQGLRDDDGLRAMLASRGVHMIYGDYFWVYHINFDANEQIAGIPSYAAADYFNYGDALGDRSVRWAMLGGRDEVERWARGVGAHGTISPDGDLWAFVADRPAPHADALIASLRRMFGN